MTAPNENPFERSVADGGPRRPNLEDFNGCEKENRGRLSNPRTHPSAEEDNKSKRLAVAYGQMVPFLAVTVRFSAGAPLVDKFVCLNSELLVSDLHLIDNGAGDVTIWWPVTKALSSQNVGPSVSLHAGVASMAPDIVETVHNDGSVDHPAVRVRTWNASGVATDLKFTATIH
jgi:hypothetical protein